MPAKSVTFGQLVGELRGVVPETDIHRVYAGVQKDEPMVLVDIREDREWVAGHIKGAIHIGKGVLERDVSDQIPDTAAPVVLYCGGGSRSLLAGQSLMRMGYTNVTSMDGGWRGWVSAGYPTEGED